jgi:hypothetical protein
MKNNLKNELINLIKGNKKSCSMKLYVQATPTDEPRLYRDVPSDRDLTIYGVDEPTCDAIIELRNTVKQLPIKTTKI